MGCLYAHMHMTHGLLFRDKVARRKKQNMNVEPNTLSQENCGAATMCFYGVYSNGTGSMKLSICNISTHL